MTRSGDQEPRIAIIGAGAAGLSAAYFLKERGYTDVTVLERLPRVGGLCRTITEGYKSFDLGANYVTPGYRETRRLARKVGARLYPKKEYIAATVPEDENEPIRYQSIKDKVCEDPQNPGQKLPLSAVGKAIAGYAWARWRLRKVLDRPDFSKVKEHDEQIETPGSRRDGRDKLCVSFGSWLDAHELTCLRPMFEIPVTMMGYGFLDEIAAPYALKFLTVGNFATMILNRTPLVHYAFRWPKRFVFGYERLWEALSWRLNVRLDVDIKHIDRVAVRRGGYPIRITLSHPSQVFHHQKRRTDTLYFDYLIVACPLPHSVLRRLMKLTKEEERLFKQIKSYSYCMTTFHCEKPPEMPKPVVCVYPFTRRMMGKPWAVVRMWEGESHLVQFYARVPISRNNDTVEQEVVGNVKTLVERMGGAVAGTGDPRDERWHTYDRWPYFGHVSAKAIAEGFYEDLELLQGKYNTFYVGGATNFELVEAAVQYAKALVEREFPRIRH